MLEWAYIQCVPRKGFGSAVVTLYTLSIYSTISWPEPFSRHALSQFFSKIQTIGEIISFSLTFFSMSSIRHLLFSLI